MAAQLFPDGASAWGKGADKFFRESALGVVYVGATADAQTTRSTSLYSHTRRLHKTSKNTGCPVNSADSCGSWSSRNPGAAEPIAQPNINGCLGSTLEIQESQNVSRSKQLA